MSMMRRGEGEVWFDPHGKGRWRVMIMMMEMRLLRVDGGIMERVRWECIDGYWHYAVY